MRGRQIFTRANIYVSDLGDLAVPMRPASGSRGLRAPRLAAVTRRSRLWWEWGVNHGVISQISTHEPTFHVEWSCGIDGVEEP